MSEIAIIGIGAANNYGANIEELFKNLELSKEDTILTNRKQINIWEQLSISPRLMKKIDGFSALAIHVCQEILLNKDSSLTKEELRNTGIFIGNVYGGWSYALPYMEQLYRGNEPNYQALSPYIATSWFPTAAQGELSILFQMLGNSKTFSAGNLSSGYSITQGMDEIRMKETEISFAGGSEVIPVELSEKYHIRMQENTVSSAAFLLLQEAEEAIQAGRKVFCYIKDYAYDNSFKDSMNKVLSGLVDRTVDAIISSEVDVKELSAIKDVFLDGQNIKVYDINTYYGKLYGSQVAMQIVLAIYFMRQKSAVQDKNYRVIVNARDSTGVYLSILLTLENEKNSGF